MADLHDRNVVRELARRVADIAALPVQDQRRQLWRQHNRLERVRPMILIFPEGAWSELLPASSLACRDELMRSIEMRLRQRIYYHEHFADDTVICADYMVNKAIS